MAEQKGEGQILATSQLDPSVVASTQLIQVKAAPTFQISAFNTNFKAQMGDQRAFYLIQLEAETGFQGQVTLKVTDLPSGLVAEFNPTSLELDGRDPILRQADCQLLISLPHDLAEGEYQYSVLGIPEQGRSQQLLLDLDLAPAKQEPTYLFLFKPNNVYFGDFLELSGQLQTRSAVELDGLTINLKLTSPDQQEFQFETQLDRKGGYQVISRRRLNQIGRWLVEASFAGNSELKADQTLDAIEVEAGLSKISFYSGRSGKLGSDYQLIGYLDPALEEAEISLKIVAPDQSLAKPVQIQSGKFGVFNYLLPATQVGEWLLTATWAGDNQYQSVSQTLPMMVRQDFGKVIMVLAGADPSVDYEWRVFHSVLQRVYRTFQRRSFDADEDIYLLSPDLNQTEGADAETSLQSLQFAITNWAVKEVGSNVPLYIYLLSHNLGDQFLIEKGAGREEYLTPTLLDNWLDLLPEETPVTLIIESCYSGNFITPPLLDSNRTIITSASAERQAKIMRSSSFSKIFFDQISTNQTISHAFERSQQWMQRHRLHVGQNPQLEADGDGQPNQIYDHRALGQRRIPDDIVSLGSPPEFVNMSESVEISSTAINRRLSAELLGQEIERVFVTILPPSYQPEQQIQNWQQLDQLVSEMDLSEIEQDSTANTRSYQFAFPPQEQLGEYTVIFQAENPDGSALPVKTLVQLTEGELTADVNDDGTVNIFDLVLVAGSFGQSGDDLRGDVNGDGAVNIFDLVKVASSFGQSLAAAPLMGADIELSTAQKHHLAIAIDQLASKANRSPAEGIVLNVLQAILPERLPIQTQLLQNYPNPFNPETWIPFELSQDTEVTVSIYDVQGKRVRQLQLGMMMAGKYVGADRAIHWDGKTESGERMASGTYFCRIEAGGYTDTRKMMILK